jgi:translocation and assembly module TamB
LSARLGEPFASLDLNGDWAEQPVAISLKAGRSVSGDLNLVLRDSRWAGIAATGNLRLRSGASLPQGDISVRAERLADLAPLLSLTGIAPTAADLAPTDLAGRLSARLRLSEQGIALIEADGEALALPGAVRIETLRLNAEVTQPLGPAVTEATLRIDGLSVGSIAGNPALARLDGQARLAGPPSAPTGTLRLQAQGLRLSQGSGRGIPPVQLNASVMLSPSLTEIDATAETGSRTRLRLLGDIGGPLFAPSRLALRADGRIDTALLDPLLTGGGRQLSGQATLATAITGTFAAPRLDGTLRLSEAALHDRTLGLALTDIDGTLVLAGDTLRVERFIAQAGPGSITVDGSVGVLVPGLPPGMPVDLRLVARNARPIQSDQLELYADADLRLHGTPTERPTLAGEVLFSRVDIRLPERLPAGIVTLQVRERGQRRSGNPIAAPSEQAWQPKLGLDLLLSAPRAVQVQGRGVDAELGGDLRVRGTLAAPAIDGGVDLIQGQYQLVGQTLRFTSGRLGFDGATGLDPTLDLEARVSAAGSTAILSVLGTASTPRIELRGEPEMPQDEVLSRLLFGVAGGRLSPLQATRLGLAAASIAGIGEGDGLGVLERARTGLGLDRLFVGTDERGDANLEGGRNITERIYLGARQGTRTGEPQGVARIEVTPRIRLEADVGVTGGTRAGAAYEREY